MSHSFPHPNRAVAGANVFPDTTDKVAGIEDFQECTVAFAHVGNTFLVQDGAPTFTFPAGSEIPLSTIQAVGFRIEPDALLFKECGTYAVSLKVSGFDGYSFEGSFIDLIKLGCRGRQTLGSISMTQVATRGLDTVIIPSECFQTGDRLQLEVRGDDLTVNYNDLLDIDLVAVKTSCCCNDDCDKCDCPCKKKHRGCC
ncbi:MAG: hypothetical protein ACE3JP_02015 [Ectobacillus sp.]